MGVASLLGGAVLYGELAPAAPTVRRATVGSLSPSRMPLAALGLVIALAAFDRVPRAG